MLIGIFCQIMQETVRYCDQTDWKNIFKIIHWQYYVILNMFCFFFSVLVLWYIFVLYFDYWYVLYLHNLKHVYAQQLLPEYGFSLTCIFRYKHIIYDSEKSCIQTYFTQWLCMQVFQIMHVTKDSVINTDC